MKILKNNKILIIIGFIGLTFLVVQLLLVNESSKPKKENKKIEEKKPGSKENPKKIVDNQYKCNIKYEIFDSEGKVAYTSDIEYKIILSESLSYLYKIVYEFNNLEYMQTFITNVQTDEMEKDEKNLTIIYSRTVRMDKIFIEGVATEIPEDIESAIKVLENAGYKCELINKE